MPVETHTGFFFAVDRRDCFDFNEVVSQSTIGALGMVLVKSDSIHDRTEKLTYVAVNVEVGVCSGSVQNPTLRNIFP